jgi:hypothetical protein
MIMEDGHIARPESGGSQCKRMPALKGDSVARQLNENAQVLNSKSAENIQVRRNPLALAIDNLVRCKMITFGCTPQGKVCMYVERRGH